MLRDYEVGCFSASLCCNLSCAERFEYNRVSQHAQCTVRGREVADRHQQCQLVFSTT
jgi:hypothetical protein